MTLMITTPLTARPGTRCPSQIVKVMEVKPLQIMIYCAPLDTRSLIAEASLLSSSPSPRVSSPEVNFLCALIYGITSSWIVGALDATTSPLCFPCYWSIPYTAQFSSGYIPLAWMSSPPLAVAETAIFTMSYLLIFVLFQFY